MMFFFFFFFFFRDDSSNNRIDHFCKTDQNIGITTKIKAISENETVMGQSCGSIVAGHVW